MLMFLAVLQNELSETNWVCQFHFRCVSTFCVVYSGNYAVFYIGESKVQ